MTRPALVGGYTTREVANLLDSSEAQVRAFARAGFVSPRSGARGELVFSFQDLLLLRTAKALQAACIPRRRIRIALANLAEQLEGRPLTAVRISARGSQVVARDGGELWEAESGQTLLDFEAADLARNAALLRRPAPVSPLEPVRRSETAVTLAGAAALENEQAEEWYEAAIAREAGDELEAAAAAYERVLGADPAHADAHLNLGRLLHERGDHGAAEAHYRQAIALRPDDATAFFNLGVVLQDTARHHEAISAYESALALDSTCADAHFNLAGVYESLGDRAAAFRHLRTYRRLIAQRG